MTDDQKAFVEKMLPKEGCGPHLVVKPLYCACSGMIYFQTDPYVRDGEVIIKRLGAVKVKIEHAHQIVEEVEKEGKYDSL